MNGRNLEMDSFLKYFGQLYYYNPDLEITNKTIYNELMNYGLSKEEENNADIKNLFSDWIDQFNESKNLNVYWNRRQSRFLQFRNQNGLQTNNNCKFFKLYISFPKDKIYNCVNKIFGFIEQNNFVTLSKVADLVRSDAVVLRMQNEEDARKVMNFINNDLEITRCAKPTNPFLVRDGVLAISYDDMLSYNSVLSDLMESYYKQHRIQNTLNNVSLNDFKNYVYKQYMSSFRNVKGIQEFSRNKIPEKNKIRCNSEEQVILNYDQIYQTIIKSLDENTKSDEIICLINKYKNANNNSVMIKYYHDSLNSNNNLLYDKSKISYAKQIVDKYILYAISKYGINDVSKYLNSYLNGNKSAITRNKNFRELFNTYISPELLLSITGPNVKEYIGSIAEIYINENNSLSPKSM